LIPEPVLRGYVLEEVLARLLRHNGYSLLVDAGQDRDALTSGANGLLVRGRGADHQVDALGELLIPTPFSLPLRLFAEAKFMSKKVDITVVRNALGVLSDVNEHHGKDGDHHFPLRRYHYRYALFSTKGFAPDAQKYALAHQISLIDLHGPAFEDLRAVTAQTTKKLLGLARLYGLRSFPLNQMRTALRRTLGTWSLDNLPYDSTYDGSFSRALRRDEAVTEQPDHLPAEPLARIAASLDERLLADALMLGFPQGPFILVLQPDDPPGFDAFLDESPAEVEVNIRYAAGGNGTSGEWAIVPMARRNLIVRFGIPPLLDSGLLEAGDAELERARLTKKTLLSTIAIFHHGNKLTRLQYRKVEHRAPAVYPAGPEPEPYLRTELAEPALAFKGRREDFELEGLEDQSAGRQPWTPEGLTELLKRLEQEGYLQAQVIRTAARQHGRISRQQIYELGDYEESRTLRGFPLPISRITRQLQNESVIPKGVSPVLRTVHGPDGRATHFVIPPDVQQLLPDQSRLI
jgi:hypothetical protein